VKHHCTQWLSSYGIALAEILADQAKKMDDDLSPFSSDIKRELQERADMESALHIISTIRDTSVQMERQIDEIEERLRTLKIFDLPQPEGVSALIATFRQRWAAILEESSKLDTSLHATKEKFKQVTLTEAASFVDEVVTFAEKFEKEAPGNPETPIDEGLELVLRYKQEHKNLCARRGELHVAEKLFGMPLTSFPQLQSIAMILGSYRQIYQLYDNQQRTMNEWSNMLWSEVDVRMLTNGIDGFEMALRKLLHEL
jgi:dynein heavy chain